MPDAFAACENSVAIRFLGFLPGEADVIEALLASQQASRFRYDCLHEDNLQDPDLYLVNADDVRALATLSDLGPSEVRPALLVASQPFISSYVFIHRPIRLPELLSALDALVVKKGEALARLEASTTVTVPERRRSSRIPSQLVDPEIYMRLRRPQAPGDVLIVDKGALLNEFIGKLLHRYNISVACVQEEEQAIAHCKQYPISLLIVNTSTPGIEPYTLCEKVKKDVRGSISVVFLVGKTFDYDGMRARIVGCNGFLNKPLQEMHLISMLKKFLPQLV